MPLTWGGTRRAALEFERTLQDRAAHARRVQLRHLEPREPALRDRRSARRAEGARRAQLRRTSSARASTRRKARSSSATQTTTCGRSARTSRSTRAATRPSRATPSCSARGWTGLHVTGHRSADQPLHDRRARLPAASSARPSLAGACAVLHRRSHAPAYERLLLGGASNLRGFRTGTFDGDGWSSRRPSCACRSRRC